MNRFREVLHEYWGYDSFRPLQEEIITSVFEGKDTLGLMPTGGGKSLTFQVPAMVMDGLCLVVTPLIALMKDQVDNLKQRGIKATSVHSGMSRKEILTALDNCIYGDYKFLYVSPERLSTELFLKKVIYMDVCLIAVDESHCISQWGYDFRPSYLEIPRLRDFFPEVPVLALTATATPQIVEDIQEKLHFRAKNVFSKSFERPNLAYVVRRTADKLFEIVKILNSVPGSAIVYVRSRKRTKEIALELQRRQIDADYFHAGLTVDEKSLKQNRWKNDQCRVMVSTNAFGMGIDKPDVRVVIHYELPGSLEEYFQEAGRAGRDEGKAYAVTLYSELDSRQLKRRIKDEFPEKDFIRDVYEKLAYFFQIGMGMGIGKGYNFVLEDFCRIFKYNRTQAYHALKILDLSGYIEYIEDTDKRSRLMFILSKEDLYRLRELSVEADQLIQILLRSYTGLFVDYSYINESLLAQRSGLSPDRVYELLKYLSANRVIHYIPAQKVPTIYYVRDREELKHLRIPPSVYELRKERLKERVKNALYYGSTDECCRSRILLTYFGEEDVHDCGICDVCLARKHREKSDADTQRLMDHLLELVPAQGIELSELIKLGGASEEQTIEAIRFLCDANQLRINDNLITPY